MTSKWSSNYRLKSFRWHNLRTLWCHKRKNWVIMVCLDREVQDLKSAIDDQTRNYRDLQVCFSKSLTILSFNLRITNCNYSDKYSDVCKYSDIYSDVCKYSGKYSNNLQILWQAASEKVLTDNRDFKSMQVIIGEISNFVIYITFIIIKVRSIIFISSPGHNSLSPGEEKWGSSPKDGGSQ